MCELPRPAGNHTGKGEFIWREEFLTWQKKILMPKSRKEDKGLGLDFLSIYQYTGRNSHSSMCTKSRK